MTAEQIKKRINELVAQRELLIRNCCGPSMMDGDYIRAWRWVRGTRAYREIEAEITWLQEGLYCYPVSDVEEM